MAYDSFRRRRESSDSDLSPYDRTHRHGLEAGEGRARQMAPGRPTRARESSVFR